MCPLKLNSEDILDHLNMPFAGDRKATALRLIDLALILEEFLHQENKDQLILDIGVGGGWTTEWFNRFGLNPISIDISSNWYNLMIERGIQTPFIISDAEEVSFKDETFDFINCYNALHHMPYQQKVVQECYRILKKDGRAVFLEPGYKHTQSLMTKSCMRQLGTVEFNVNPFHLKRMCLNVGFKNAYIKTTYTNLTPISERRTKGLYGDLILGVMRVLRSLRSRAFIVAIK